MSVYQSTSVPESYKCCECGAHGCKLWREYMCFLDRITLKCCDCSAKEQEKDVSTIDQNGLRFADYGLHTDQIGWRIPAVLTDDGSTYWGYTSVPNDGIAWWRRLPTRMVQP